MSNLFLDWEQIFMLDKLKSWKISSGFRLNLIPNPQKNVSPSLNSATSTLIREFQAVLDEPLDLKHYEENPVR